MFRLLALLEWLELMRRQIAVAAVRFCNIEMMYAIQSLPPNIVQF